MAKKKHRGRNEGSIYRNPSGTWRAQISLTNGKRISKSFPEKADALRWNREMTRTLELGLDIDGGKQTVEEFLSNWLECYRMAVRAKTLHRYLDLANRFIIPKIGDIRLIDLSPLQVEMLYGKLLEEGVGVRTVRHTHSVLHKAMEEAIRYGMILTNPAKGVPLPKHKPREMIVWDATQVSIFLVAAEKSRHCALYYLAVTTGMRQGELFGLQWADLHFSSGVIRVQRQVQSIPGQGWHFSEPKTKAGRRTIKLGEGVLHALRKHKDSQSSEIALAGDTWKNHSLIFPNKVGNPLNPSNLRVDFNRVILEAGLPKIRFHDLRHTAASIMLNNGIAPIVVSNILGHSKPSVTMDIYGHLLYQLQDEAAILIDSLVTPIRVDIDENVNIGRGK